MKAATAPLGVKHLFIKPHCPWQNGKVERFNRTIRPSGPTAGSSPATPTAPQPLRHGSSTTTLNAATAHSEDYRPSADCYQPDGRVHLAADH